MDIQTFIAQKEAEIQAAIEEYEATKQDLEAEIKEAEQLRDNKIAKLQQERSDAIMKEKLKQFPKELVENHKTCSVCGGNMRPYQFMEGETVVKAWACQAGGLQEGHDLIRIEK